MIQTTEAHELCSTSEWAAVESSFSPAIETLSPSDLRSKLSRVRKLQERVEDLVNRQHSDARKRTTRRKAELFAEAVARFEGVLKVLEKAHRVAPISKSIEGRNLEENTRTLTMDALQQRADHELVSRKKHVLAAAAVRGEQQGNKSGSRRIQSHVGSSTRRHQARRDMKNK